MQNNIMVCGENGVSAKILRDSITKNGDRLITFEVTFWRGVLAELNAHRMLVKNTSSSRAIPFGKMLSQLNGRPHRFGKNQSGMQDAGAHDSDVDASVFTLLGYNSPTLPPEEVWKLSGQLMSRIAQSYADAGYHKQVYNRLVEPFQTVKAVISATELENFFWLRDDVMADPSIRELARCMREARAKSQPTFLLEGEWHLPYVDVLRAGNRQVFTIEDEDGSAQVLCLQDAIQVSCARVAAVSFRNVNYGLAKSKKVYATLTEDKVHGSALEHCATPLANTIDPYNPWRWGAGVTHVTRDGSLWSGPFKGWGQYRKSVPNENYTGETNA